MRSHESTAHQVFSEFLSHTIMSEIKQLLFDDTQFGGNYYTALITETKDKIQKQEVTPQQGGLFLVVVTHLHCSISRTQYYTGYEHAH